MLTRSASGPGGLSINTGSANLFGGTTTTAQAPAAGGLFGSTATATPQPQATGGLFGNPAATPQPAQTGGLFGGATATAASQPTQTGGLFGGATATAQPAQTGGLFGGSTTTAQPQQTGGLFGSSTATTQPQQTGGLFGGATATPAQPAGGLFGGSLAQPQQQQQQTGGLFGSKPAQTTMTGGLFQSTQQQQPQTNNTFGQSAMGPGLTMGQSQQQQQQQQQNTVPGVRIDVSNIRSTTRFNDLQEDLQKQIEEIDKAIQGFINQKNELDAFMPAHGEQLSSIPNDVAFVSRKAAGVEGALASDAVAIKQLRELVKVDADNAKLSFKAVDNLRLPTSYHQAGLWSTRGQQAPSAGSPNADEEGGSDLVSFFSRTADEMGDTMKKFERNLGEIEMHLHGVQANVLEQLQRVAATPKEGGQNGSDDKIQELAAVLRDFEESILQVAGQVGGAREGMTGLQLGDVLGNGHGY